MKQYLKIMKESTYGTAPTVAGTAGVDFIWVELAENDPSVDVKPTTYTISGSRPSRGVVEIQTGSSQYSVGGSIQTYLYHEQAAFWNTAAFSPTVTNNLPDLPSYTIHKAYADNSGTFRGEQFTGCKFTSATLSGSNSGSSAAIGLSLNLVGSKFIDSISLSSPSCTVFPSQLYTWSMCDLQLGGVSLKSLMRSVSLSISHKTNPIFHANAYADRIAYYGWDPKIASTWDLDSHGYTTKYRQIMTSFAAAAYSSGTNKFELVYDPATITLKKTTFTLFNVVIAGLNTSKPPTGDFTQSADLMPYYDCANMDMTCAVVTT